MYVQPGTAVEVLQNFTDGTTQIGFGGRIGFINQTDLR
jgi:hypothetical protein